ncbi:uncharacterized protein LOC127651396 [Xyrauchen texanus]|uniref:uncharacterized protein LOC127651396 n=1 Tax=Xyrauchen texanus TaxID=154827 RepID=UPI0022418D83|nr:uncharacterized protein LOC127651396 [Xyrauchen texanus]
MRAFYLQRCFSMHACVRVCALPAQMFKCACVCVLPAQVFECTCMLYLHRCLCVHACVFYLHRCFSMHACVHVCFTCTGVSVCMRVCFTCTGVLVCMRVCVLPAQVFQYACVCVFYLHRCFSMHACVCVLPAQVFQYACVCVCVLPAQVFQYACVCVCVLPAQVFQYACVCVFYLHRCFSMHACVCFTCTGVSVCMRMCVLPAQAFQYACVRFLLAQVFQYPCMCACVCVLPAQVFQYACMCVLPAQVFQYACVCVSEFQHCLQLELASSPTPLDVEGKWTRFRTVAHVTAMAVLGTRSRPPQKPWLMEEVFRLAEKKQQAHSHRLQHPTSENEEAYRSLRSEVWRAVRRCKDGWWSRVAEEMESASVAHVHKSLFNSIKKVTCSATPITIIRGKNGDPISDPQKQVCRFAEHFCEVLGEGKSLSLENIVGQSGDDPAGAAVPQILEEEVARCGWLAEVPSLEEVLKAIQSLRLGKAPGRDDLPSEMLREGGVCAQTALHDIITTV